MKSRRVYIASPYTVGDKSENVRRHLAVADDLLGEGYAPYVPLLTHYWDLIYPHQYEVWMNLDLKFLEVCDVVLRLPGKSPGADREVALAERLRIPVVYSITQLMDLYPPNEDTQAWLWPH